MYFSPTNLYLGHALIYSYPLQTNSFFQQQFLLAIVCTLQLSNCQHIRHGGLACNSHGNWDQLDLHTEILYEKKNNNKENRKWEQKAENACIFKCPLDQVRSYVLAAVVFFHHKGCLLLLPSKPAEFFCNSFYYFIYLSIKI